jgi:hypothetical protein
MRAYWGTPRNRSGGWSCTSRRGHADRFVLDDVRTALQLIEHRQDVAETARGLHRARRIWCAGDERDLRAPAASPSVRALPLEVERARRSWTGEPLVTPPAARLAVAGFVAGGRARPTPSSERLRRARRGRRACGGATSCGDRGGPAEPISGRGGGRRARRPGGRSPAPTPARVTLPRRGRGWRRHLAGAAPGPRDRQRAARLLRCCTAYRGFLMDRRGGSSCPAPAAIPVVAPGGCTARLRRSRLPVFRCTGAQPGALHAPS